MSDRSNDTNFVAGAIIAKNGKIFVARRADHKKAFPGLFELVGGHVEKGETFEEAVIREVKEEVCLDIEIITIIDAFKYYSEDEYKAEVIYLCRQIDPDQEPIIDPDDHSEGMWIGPDEVHKIERDTEEVRAIRKAFEILELEGEQ